MGQSVDLKHLAEFIRISKLKYEKSILESFGYDFNNLEESKDIPENEYTIIKDLSDKLLRKELSAGVQTITYQINTLNKIGA